MSREERGRGGGEEASGGLGARIARALGQTAAAVLGLLLLAAVSGVLVLSQTATGRETAASLLEDALQGAVDGRVEVGAITGGNLVTRSVLERFRIVGPSGRTFVDLRDVRVAYNPLGLLRGEIHLRRMRVGRLELQLLQDEDGSWNYERIFAGGDTAADGGGTSLQVSDLRVADGRLEVRTPWSTETTGAARDSARRAVLAGEEIWHYERTARGLSRVISLRELSGRLPFLRLADPERPMRVELERVEGRLRAVSQPLAVHRLDASAIVGDTVQVDLRRVEIDGSRLQGPGWVVPADPPRFRFELEADRLELADLRWLPVPVPDEGGGPVDLVLRTTREGDVTVVDARNARIRSGESRLDGGFTLFLDETPRLEDVALDLDPLRLGLVNRLLDRPDAPGGWVRGRVSGSGPLDLFRLDATLRLWPPSADGEPPPTGEERPPDDSAPPPSYLAARGAVGLTGESRALRDLELELEAFDPHWTRLMGVETDQVGRLSGTTTLDGTVAGGIAFTADLRRRAPGDSTSHVRANGFFRPADPAEIDVEVDARPLSLSVLDPYFPNLNLVGTVRGPASASGTMADLRARADLETPRGQLRIDGQFDLVAERKRYDATVAARGLQLRQWFEQGPITRLAVRGRVEGVGTDPEDLEARFDLEVLPSTFEGARIDSSLLRFTVREGLARVDTFAIRTDAGTLRGRGGFGLTGSRSAALYLTVEAPDLSSWNRWIVPGRNPVRPDTSAGDLFALFPDAPRGPEEEATEQAQAPDSLVGSLTARGVVYGNPTQMGFGGRVTADSAAYGGTAADSLRLTLDATSVRALDSLVVTGRAWNLARGAQRADSASFRVERRGPDVSEVRVRAVRGDSAGIEVGGALTWTEARRAAEMDLLQLTVGEQRLRLEGEAGVVVGDSGLVVRGLSLVGDRGARLRAEGRIPDRGEARFDLELEEIDLADLSDVLVAGEGVRGRLGGTVDVRGTAASPRLDAALTIDSAGYRERTYRRLRATVGYVDRRLSGSLVLGDGGEELVRLEGSVAADLSFRDVERRLLRDPLDLTLRADSLPLNLVLLPLGSVRDVSGHGSGSIRIMGSPEDPRLDGRLSLVGGSAHVIPLDVRYRQIRGAVQFQGSEARVDSLTAASAQGGRLAVNGTVGLASFTQPSFDLRIRTMELRAIQRRRVAVTVDGEGTLGGNFEAPTLEGTFQLSNGTVRTETLTRQDEVVDLTDPELIGLVDTATVAEERLLDRAQNPFVQNLRARLDLRVGPDFWLRSPDLQVEMAGELEVRIARAEEDVTVYGDLQLVRGTYRWTWGPRGAFSRQLRITDGRIEFVGTPGLNPNLAITAVHRTRTDRGNLTVSVEVGGTMAEPTLSLASEPQMPESDRVCVLLMNSPCTAPGAAQLARDQLLGRVSSELSTALASEVGIDYLEVRSSGQRNDAAGAEAGTGAAETSLFADAEVEAGWYLSPEVFLTVTYPVGSRFPEGSLDWRFADQWSLELLSELRFDDPIGRGSDSNLGRERRWGLFLFREWTF